LRRLGILKLREEQGMDLCYTLRYYSFFDSHTKKKKYKEIKKIVRRKQKKKKQ